MALDVAKKKTGRPLGTVSQRDRTNCIYPMSAESDQRGLISEVNPPYSRITVVGE